MMKGEYVEEMKDHSNTMFAKLHQTQKFHHHHHPYHQPPPPPPQPQAQPTFHHPFQVAAAARECQTSEDTDSRSPNTPSTTGKQPITPQPISAVVGARTPSSGNDGATIEVVRRPRGRPPGSKNKPRPPVVITRDAEPGMSPYILELPGGVDIIDSTTRFCRKRNMGLCILNGSGTVSNVTLRQPSTTPGATVTFHGRFDILSISATLVGPNATFPSLGSILMTNGIANGFTISLAGPQGQVVGGAVAGPLLSAGTVYLIAATFTNPSYHRLPAAAEEDGKGSGGGNDGPDLQHSPPHTDVSGGGDSGAADSCGISMYNSCHMPPDVIWAPTARQPPPPY
ncbi:PREDICTED: AT-hook motif nuclear-localized protein 17-like [Ipomoea nil]|uniref:AT-hook motif nuclear-localized protein 17-like n=1 Tax=Ipomoea nil TaxID=35883 RepID=UPI0009014F22|nr:PREDICTED: AT-hook motif nuclear-localized protein 17-like [Ipomoea nil]